MTDRGDIEKGKLVYTKLCGWIDMGHANPKSSTLPTRGAANLLNAIIHEQGQRSKNGLYYKIQFDMKGYFAGVYFGPDSTLLAVKSGLSIKEKQELALYIFLNKSTQFEHHQDTSFANLGATFIGKGGSGFSIEDIPSNLLGFYRAMHPDTDYLSLCQPVSQLGAQRIWDTYGGVTRDVYKLRAQALDNRGLPRVVLFPTSEYPDGPKQITLTCVPWFLSEIIPSNLNARPWRDDDPALAEEPPLPQVQSTPQSSPLQSKGYAEIEVRPGDTLSGMTKSVYGDLELWPLIWDINLDRIGGDPNLIQPRQRLQISAEATLHSAASYRCQTAGPGVSCARFAFAVRDGNLHAS